MKYRSKLSFSIIMAFLLAGCSTTYNQNSMIQRVVKRQKLANGTTILYGYRAPKAKNACTQLAKQGYNWGVERFKGMTNISGGYGLILDQGTDYLNKHPEIKADYMYIYVPDEHKILNINYDAMDKAYVTYYSCKRPPAYHNSPF